MKTKHNASKTIYFITQSITRLGLSILVFTTTVTFGQSGSCSANLKVEKDRNTRSTPLDGTYYTMEIKNTGNTSGVFVINPNNSLVQKPITGGNTSIQNLQASILDDNLNSFDRISLSAGETVKFFVHITVPSGIAFNKSYDTTIVAKSLSCPNYTTNIILHTFVMNPNED